MKIVGITGGMGSGKTKVASGLRDYGAALIDADAKGHIALGLDDIQNRLFEVFGDDIMTSDGIDRQKLAELAFKSDQAIQNLNKIVHPKILTLITEELQTCSKMNYPYVVIDAALLFEVNLDKMCDCAVTVDAPIAQCIERIKIRDNMTQTQIRQRMRYQLSFEEKRIRADYVLKNNGTLENLDEKIKSLHEWILHSC